jgi:hypothetical protein
MAVNIVYTPGWEIAEEEGIMRRVAWQMRWLGAELASKVSLSREGDLFMLRYRGRAFPMSAKVANPETVRAAAKRLVEEASE